jgi:hypothetical protein
MNILYLDKRKIKNRELESGRRDISVGLLIPDEYYLLDITPCKPTFRNNMWHQSSESNKPTKCISVKSGDKPRDQSLHFSLANLLINAAQQYRRWMRIE